MDRSKCLIVTLNFLSAQGEAARLVSADGRSYCRTKFQEPQFGKDQTQAKARSKWRPPHPDVIWHFHGLWSLPGGGGGSPEGLDCADRFRADVAAVRAWVHDTPDVVWQTTFPILGHQSIRNPYLLWEYNCQRRSVHVARTQGGAHKRLAMYDLYAYVRDRLPGSIRNDDPTHGFHFTADVANHITDEVTMCIRLALGRDLAAGFRQSAYRKAGRCKATAHYDVTNE